MRSSISMLLVVATLGLGALSLPSLVASLRPAEGVIDDFFQEWASARNHLSGMPVYGKQSLALAKHLAMKRVDEQGFWIEYNAHPPSSVLLVLPLGALPYREAALAWNLLSLACLAASLWIVQRQLALRVTAIDVLLVVAVLSLCSPLRQQIHHGQLNLVLLLLLTGAWAAARSDKSAWAGALVAVAMAIKLFPGFLFVYFLARRDWKALASGTLTVLAISGLTATVLGPQAYIDYVTIVLPTLGHFQQSWLNASLAGYWHRLFNAGSVQTVPLWPATWLAHLLTVASAAMVTLLAGWRAFKAETREQQDRAYALTMIGMILVSPVAWDHYFLLLLLPIPILWRALRPTANEIERASNWQRHCARWIFVGVLLVLCLNPRIVWDRTIPGPREIDGGIAMPWQSLTVLGYQVLSLLTLFAVGWKACGWKACSNPATRGACELVGIPENQPRRDPPAAGQIRY